WRTEFLDKFEGDAGAFLGIADGVRAVVPRPLHRARTERVAASAAEGVPVNDRKAQVVAHRLALDDFAGIVMLERERVFGTRPFERNFAYVCKSCFHFCVDNVGRLQPDSSGHNTTLRK